VIGATTAVEVTVTPTDPWSTAWVRAADTLEAFVESPSYVAVTVSPEPLAGKLTVHCATPPTRDSVRVPPWQEAFEPMRVNSTDPVG
jgi:hypothetical protein